MKISLANYTLRKLAYTCTRICKKCYQKVQTFSYKIIKYYRCNVQQDDYS